ncbi:MAG: hypothetical protein PHS73_02910 [Candidatus Peribacteraceae bacterium]|nr:hypothetical protein [Candidatus Peribacteraceae bacterium]
MRTALFRHWHRLSPLLLLAIPRAASAANDVLGDASEIDLGGGTETDLKQVIIDVIQAILQFVGVIAVAMIVIAGIWLIVGAADDSSKEKAKKIIIYTIVGLLVILLAEAIVQFVLDIGQSN